MKSIYLHIGFHKTGTSALQEALDENREKLRKNGFFYPESILGFPAQQEMSWSIIKDKRKWMELSQTTDEVYASHLDAFLKSGAGNLILSSEDFTFLDNDEKSIEGLYERLRDYKVRVVCYIREPVDFLISLYNHRLRVGDTTLPFEDYLFKKLNPNVAMFNYRLRFWEKVFGKENMIVRKYDKDAFVGGSVYTDFMNALGSSLKLDVEKGKTSNVGVHPALKDLYAFIFENLSDERERNSVLEKASSLSSSLPKVASKRYYLSEDVATFLNKLYAPMRREIKEKYGINLG